LLTKNSTIAGCVLLLNMLFAISSTASACLFVCSELATAAIVLLGKEATRLLGKEATRREVSYVCGVSVAD
jgi:hypothetical protein